MKKLVFTCPKCGSHDLTEFGRSQYEAHQFSILVENMDNHMLDYGEVDLVDDECEPVVYSYSCNGCGELILQIDGSEEAFDAHRELIQFATDNEPMFRFVEEEAKIEIEPLVQVPILL